jgi:Protein of unknown function DUF72
LWNCDRLILGPRFGFFVNPPCARYRRCGGIVAKLSRVSGAIEFRVGTASLTDPSLTNSDLFYPLSVRSAEERLRFYAERFNTVEVDSTYYALPPERNAKLWAERTPGGFLFNIKPFRAHDAAPCGNIAASTRTAGAVQFRIHRGSS